MMDGLDVSHYQSTIDWLKVRKSGIAFAFAKSTEGSRWVDPTFHQNWLGMKAAGIVRGAYMFFRPGEEAVLQAKHLCATARLEAGDLPLVIDVEKEGLSPTLYAASLKTCLHTVAQISGLQPIIYCSPAWWNTHLTGDFSAYPLFVAHYTHAPFPNLPHGWYTATFWQWSSSGQIPGISGHVDVDRFLGDLSALKALTKP